MPLRHKLAVLDSSVELDNGGYVLDLEVESGEYTCGIGQQDLRPRCVSQFVQHYATA